MNNHPPTSLYKVEDKNEQPINILFIMAADFEYGETLKSMGIQPVIIGVGPIQAGINTANLLKDLAYQNALPDLVVNLGSAGSDQYDQKTILQASQITYRDMDASPFGFEKGQTPFSTLPAILPIDIQIPGIPTTTISTGANVVSDFSSFDQETAEMEAYAAYSACLTHDIPFIKIIGISDGKQALTGEMEDWIQCLPEIDKKLADAVASLQNYIEETTKETLLKSPLQLEHQEEPNKNAENQSHPT